ncbi:MAG: zinc ribbon domain-containing protein [Acidobacteriota bacterium]
MYCPRCGHEPNESVRFCSRCGFQLNEVKNMLVSGQEPGARLLPLRQKDINLGAGLTLIGVIKALFLASLLSVPSSKEMMVGLYFLAAVYAIFLLVAHLSPRQRGLSLGATLMFLGALVAAPATMGFGIAGLLTVAAILIPLILFWLPLLRGALKFFFEADAPLPAQRERDALPPVDHSINATRRPIASEVAAAPSVTENTTSLLEED